MIEIVNMNKIAIYSYDKLIKNYDWKRDNMEVAEKIIADFSADDIVFVVKVNGFGVIIYECLKSLGVNVVAFNLKRKYSYAENE